MKISGITVLLYCLMRSLNEYMHVHVYHVGWSSLFNTVTLFIYSFLLSEHNSILVLQLTDYTCSLNPQVLPVGLYMLVHSHSATLTQTNSKRLMLE